MMVYSMLALKGEVIQWYKFMKTLKSGKAVNPDDIPVEVMGWLSL